MASASQLKSSSRTMTLAGHVNPEHMEYPPSYESLGIPYETKKSGRPGSETREEELQNDATNQPPGDTSVPPPAYEENQSDDTCDVVPESVSSSTSSCLRRRAVLLVAGKVAATIAVLTVIIFATVWITLHLLKRNTKVCGDPGQLNHGVKTGNTFNLGKSIQYKCKRGFRLSGSSRRTCLQSGKWSGVRPICFIVMCADPGPIHNGVRTGSSFNYRQRIYYRCNRGYIRVGNQSRVCQESGEWSGSNPTCAIAASYPMGKQKLWKHPPKSEHLPKLWKNPPKTEHPPKLWKHPPKKPQGHSDSYPVGKHKHWNHPEHFQQSNLESMLPQWMKPLLDMHMMEMKKSMPEFRRVAALPGGGAVMYTRMDTGDMTVHQLIKMNQYGQTAQEFYHCIQCVSITGLIVIMDKLHVLHKNGTKILFSIVDGKLLAVNHIQNVLSMTNTGSQNVNPNDVDDPDLLLLADQAKGEIFTFNQSTSLKVVRKTGLARPTSVSSNNTFHVVCESDKHRILVFSSSWNLMLTFGGQGAGDGQLQSPKSAVVTTDAIIVADSGNDRVSQFTFDGRFVKHTMTRSDGLKEPFALSFLHPHLFIIHKGNTMYRYKLYE